MDNPYARYLVLSLLPPKCPEKSHAVCSGPKRRHLFVSQEQIMKIITYKLIPHTGR